MNKSGLLSACRDCAVLQQLCSLQIEDNVGADVPCWLGVKRDLEMLQDWRPEDFRVTARDFVEQAPVLCCTSTFALLPLLIALSCTKCTKINIITKTSCHHAKHQRLYYADPACGKVFGHFVLRQCSVQDQWVSGACHFMTGPPRVKCSE